MLGWGCARPCPPIRYDFVTLHYSFSFGPPRNTYTHLLSSYLTGQCLSMTDTGEGALQDQMELVVDIREYDVPFHVRVSIDLKINVAYWYSVR